jgi:outer membrane lipoprotein-sorting protein
MLAAAASPASAFVKDPVPLPHLRPGVARASASSAAAPAPRRAAGPMTQAELLTNVNNYFNSFRTMEGQFVQFGPHGEQSEGVFFLSRPGRIRFHYRPPVRLDVIADGSTVAVRDNKAMTQDLYPLSKTPLRYLLAAHIDLTSTNVVQSVHQDSDVVSLVIVQNSSFGSGKLTLFFDKRTFALKQWVVTDAQGLDTTVAIYNVSLNKPEDPGLFRINLITK